MVNSDATIKSWLLLIRTTTKSHRLLANGTLPPIITQMFEFKFFLLQKLSPHSALRQNSLLCTFICCSLNGEIEISIKCVGFQKIFSRQNNVNTKLQCIYSFSTPNTCTQRLQLSDFGNSITILASRF